MIIVDGHRVTTREATGALKVLQRAADDVGYIENTSLVDTLIGAGFEKPRAAALNKLLGALRLRSTVRHRRGDQVKFDHVIDLTTPTVTEKMLRSLHPAALSDPSPGTTIINE